MPPKSSPRGVLLKGENTTRELCVLPDFDPQKPEIYPRYFRQFYARINDTGSRFYIWLVRDVNPNLFFQFRTAASNFKLIDDQAQRSVIVRYEKNEKLLNELRFIGPTREIMRQLQRYTVNLPARMTEIMLANGLLEEVDTKKASGIIVQCDLKLYDDKTGLDIYRQSLPVDDLIQ
jgi:CRISPR-associated endonuclease/helicase Cas3